MNIHAFKTVSDLEVQKLMGRLKFKNFFKILRSLSLIDGFPSEWLITSIDYSSQTGKRRYPESPNHYDSMAVDIVPLTDDLKIRLPIPLNRNLLLMRTLKTLATEFDNSALPVIAFEADHLHIDVNHEGGVAYYNAVRPFIDRRGAALLMSPAVKKAIDSKDLVYI